MNRQCGYEKLLGMVILGVGYGVPHLQNFFDKKCYFHISPKFELMAVKKLGIGTHSLRGTSPPENFFLHSRLGLAKCFHSHFAMVGLCRFRALPMELAEYDFFSKFPK